MTSAPKLLAVTALLWAGGCTSASAIERSDEYLSEGHLYLAYHELEQELRAQQAEGAVDPELERRHRELRPKYLILRGRLAIYADHEVEGLSFLAEVLQQDPDNQVALELQQRAYKKMARRATQRGQNELAQGRIEAALAAFQEALTHVPGYPDAEQGVAAVRESVAKLHAEAQQQFLEAVRKWPEFRYPEVNWHAGAALSRVSEREDAKQVRDKARIEMIDRAVASAGEDREAGHYGAALMEYRRARDLADVLVEGRAEPWPGVAGIDEHIEHMEREVAAQEIIEKAMLYLKADRLDDAGAQLDQAVELTSLQRATINEIQHQIRVRAGELAYDRARDFELQGLKQEALAAFEALVAEWPDGLRDEKTRVSALRIDIEGAEEAYAAGLAAEQAGDLDEALDQFRTARTYYERYRDVEQRIERLERAIREREAGQAPNGQAPNGDGGGESPAGRRPADGGR